VGLPIDVQDGLDEVVLVIVHQFVGSRGILEGQVMGYDKGRIELTLLNVSQQLLPIPN